eukprot:12934483-Prorocentrum_lima.AAC.1
MMSSRLPRLCMVRTLRVAILKGCLSSNGRVMLSKGPRAGGNLLVLSVLAARTSALQRASGLGGLLAAHSSRGVPRKCRSRLKFPNKFPGAVRLPQAIWEGDRRRSGRPRLTRHTADGH